MIDQIFSKIIRLRKIWGIHIYEYEDAKFEINAVLLKQKKNTIYLQDSRHLESIEELKQLDITNIPLSISYGCGKVLNKKIKEYNDNVLQHTLHVSTFDEFYIQVYNSKHNFLSVIRKKQFDPILKILNETGAQVISIVLGPVNLDTGLLYLEDNPPENRIQTCNYSLTIKNGFIEEIKDEINQEISNIKFGEETLNQKDLLPYCNALAFMIHTESPNYLSVANWSNLIMEYKYNIFFKRALPKVLVSFFIILLLNFGILQYQESKHNQLTTEYSQFQGQIKRLESLKQDFIDKQIVVEKLALANYGYLSYFADRLSASVNEYIKFTNLEINPRIENNRSDKNEYIFNFNTIKIEGICESTSALNEWLKQIESEKFVEKIDHQVFQFNEYDEKGHFSFQLKVIRP